MLMEELLKEGKDEDHPYWGPNEKYEDLIERVTKVMGKPTEQKEKFNGAHKFTYWMKSDKTGEHVGVSCVNGHLGISVLYKGPWFDVKARANPWSAHAHELPSGTVDALFKKLRTSIKSTIKKSKDHYGYSSRINDAHTFHDSKEAEEFLQKISTELK
jgi:hypothetical protein